MSDERLVFVSYARSDRAPVQRIVDELRILGIQVWIDSANLVAGEDWTSSIARALDRASNLIVFVSPESMRSKWTLAEVQHAAHRGVRVVPVLLKRTPLSNLPPALSRIQWIDVSTFPVGTAFRQTAQEIARALRFDEKRTVGEQLGLPQQQNLAKALAAQSRGSPADDSQKVDERPTSTFVVHGHDEDFLHDVAEFVKGLGIEPIIMKDVGGASTSLIEKFFEVGGSAKYAIILLSGDDFGVSRTQFETSGVGERALQYRARQNVVLELGYFYGLLGWENVFVLEKAPPKVFPNFERPSDLNGVLFDRYDATGRWRTELHRRLSTHGFELPALK
jgi:predicted nucleotide-binding protein